MNVKRILALLAGLALLVAGGLRWASLWHYTASAKGQIIALTYLDSSSGLLGLSFAQHSAHMGIHYTTPDGTAYQFIYILARSAGQAEIQTTLPVPLRYDPRNPQDAVAEVDYLAARTRGMLTALAGLLVGAAGVLIFRPRSP